MAELFTLEKEEIEPPQVPAPASSVAESAGMHMLYLGLKALSQRALVAIAALFTLLTVASAFWLFMTIKDPNTMQLIEMGMYGVFVLAANLIVRRP